MTIFLFSHGPSWLHGLPEWHPSWPRFHKAPRVSHWPHQAPDPSVPLGGLQLAVLHGGLVLCNVVWSSLHILMAVPLRKGANAAVLSFLREIIGFFALVTLAATLDRGQRPPLTRRLVGLFALAGALSALIRITIIAALQHAGPDVTAAITPATPVITLVATLALGMETLRLHASSGKLQVAGLSLCSISACAMAFLKGPILFGKPPSGAHAPTNIPLGASFMLFNCVISAMVQIVNKKALALYPLLSSTACVEAFAVSWLGLIAAASAPRKDWWVDGSVAAAVIFGGLLATAMNNILLARANKRLGPLVANMYVPVQPLTTATLDYIFLGDAFYAGNFVCGVGVISGLVLCKLGKVRELREIGDDLRTKVLAHGDAGAEGDETTVLAAATQRLVRRRSLYLLAQPPSALVDRAVANALQDGADDVANVADEEAPAGGDAEMASLLSADGLREAAGV